MGGIFKFEYVYQNGLLIYWSLMIYALGSPSLHGDTVAVVEGWMDVWLLRAK